MPESDGSELTASRSDCLIAGMGLPTILGTDPETTATKRKVHVPPPPQRQSKLGRPARHQSLYAFHYHAVWQRNTTPARLFSGFNTLPLSVSAQFLRHRLCRVMLNYGETWFNLYQHLQFQGNCVCQNPEKLIIWNFGLLGKRTLISTRKGAEVTTFLTPS
jgi:hypothetical protein